MNRRARCAVGSSVLAAVLVSIALLHGTGEALTVTNTNSLLAGHFAQDTLGDEQHRRTSPPATLIAPGGAVADLTGAFRTFTTRYTATAFADEGADTGSLTVSYRVAFTVLADAGWQYSIAVTTRMFGAVTVNEDEGGDGTAQALISNTAGTYAGGGFTGGTLNSTVAANTGVSGVSVNTQFLDDDTFAVIGLVATGAVQNFTLDFTWTMRADSNDNSDEEEDNNGLESAVRLGIGNFSDSNDAENYPGAGARNATCNTTPPSFNNCDGHFVTVRVTEVGAPGVQVPTLPALALVVASLLGAGGVAWKRRR